MLIQWDLPDTVVYESVKHVSVLRHWLEGVGWDTIDGDTTWGFAFDDNNIEDETRRYQVEILNQYGGVVHTIFSEELTVYEQTLDFCVITIDVKDQTGKPNRSRRVHVADPRTRELLFVLAPNSTGQVKFALKHFADVKIWIEGSMTALHTIVPNDVEATWSDLEANGSVILTDTRGMF